MSESSLVASLSAGRHVIYFLLVAILARSLARLAAAYPFRLLPSLPEPLMNVALSARRPAAAARPNH